MKTYDRLAFSQEYSTAPRAMYVELVYGFYSLFLVYSLIVVQVYGFYAVYANDELVCSILVWKTYMVPRGTKMVQETTKTNAYVRPLTRSSPCGVKKRGLCDPLDLTVSSPNHKSKKMKGITSPKAIKRVSHRTNRLLTVEKLPILPLHPFRSYIILISRFWIMPKKGCFRLHRL